MNEILAPLEAALERERAFVSNASHGLWTPLALLKTEIELVLAEPESVPNLAAALRSAGETADRLSQLADPGGGQVSVRSPWREASASRTTCAEATGPRPHRSATGTVIACVSSSANDFQPELVRVGRA